MRQAEAAAVLCALTLLSAGPVQAQLVDSSAGVGKHKGLAATFPADFVGDTGDSAWGTVRLRTLPIQDAGDTNSDLRCKVADEVYDGPAEAPQCPNVGKCEDAAATSAEQRYFTQCRGCFRMSPGCKSGFSADPDGYVNTDKGEETQTLSMVKGLSQDESTDDMPLLQVFGRMIMRGNAATRPAVTEPAR
jgi:hypothetical protein